MAAPPSANKVDSFLFKSLGGLIEQLNYCLQPYSSSISTKKNEPS